MLQSSPGFRRVVLLQLMSARSRLGGNRGRIVADLLHRRDPMIEPLLCGIVLGLIPVTLLGLFVAAWNQYRRGGSALGG